MRNGDTNITAVPADGGVRTAVTNLSGTVTRLRPLARRADVRLIHASQTAPARPLH